MKALTGTEPAPSPEPTESIHVEVAEEEFKPSTRPFSAVPAIAVGLILVFLCKGMFFGGGGNNQAAVAAQNAAASQRPASTTPQHASAASPRYVPLRPPPANGCVQDVCAQALGYASLIVDVGRRWTNLPQRAWVIAVAAAMQESSLQNEANNAYPESLSFPYDIVGGDHDSLGLFQQRPSQGWGKPEELMDPRTATQKFYNALAKTVSGWKDWQDPAKVRLTDIIQAVQHSKYPDAYQKREPIAAQVVDYVLRYTYTGSAIGTTASNPWFVMIRCAKPQSKDCQEVPWRLIKPVEINRAAFLKYFPQPHGLYDGDLGDEYHMADAPTNVPDTLEDHTPVASFCWQGKCDRLGWIYAQDLAGGDKFDLNKFVRWLLDNVRAGKYKGIKYIVSTIPANKGVDGGRYYGVFAQDNGWHADDHAPDHDTHVHISYEPGWEWDTSMNIIADFYASQGA